MYPKVEGFPLNGQLQKPFTIRNTPLPVMSGAMAVCSMRSGALDTNHLKELRTPRLDNKIL